jgi:hypothetical protein
MGFSKNFIYFDLDNFKIIIFNNTKDAQCHKLSQGNVKITNGSQIMIKDLEKTTVTKTIKYLIKFHQILKKLRKDCIDPEEYFKRNIEELNLTDNSLRMKYMLNKNFNLVLKLKNEISLELIFIGYDEFKMWLNGFACVIKNKELLLSIYETD